MILALLAAAGIVGGAALFRPSSPRSVRSQEQPRCSGESVQKGVDEILAASETGASAGPYGAGAGALAGAVGYLSGPCGRMIEEKLAQLASEGVEAARKALRDIDSWRVAQLNQPGKALTRGIKGAKRTAVKVAKPITDPAKKGEKAVRQSARSTRKRIRKATGI